MHDTIHILKQPIVPNRALEYFINIHVKIMNPIYTFLEFKDKYMYIDNYNEYIDQ